MKKYLVLAVLLVVLIPAFVLAAIFVVPQHIKWASYEDKIEALIKDKSGYTVDIIGDIALSTWPEPYLEIGGVKVDAFDGEKPLFTAGKMRVELDFATLLSFGLGIKTFVLESPHVYLAINDKGVENWLPKRAKRLGGGSSSSSSDLDFIKSLGQVAITKGQFVYEDAVNVQRFAVQDFSLNISGEELAKSALNLKTVVNEIPVSAQFDMDLSDFDRIPLEGNASLGLSVIHLNGALIEPLSSAGYTGDLSVQGEDLLRSIYYIANVPPSQRSFTFPIHLKTKLNSDGGKVKVEDLNISLADGQEVEFKGSVVYVAPTSREKAFIEASLISEKELDLTALGLCTQPKKVQKGKDEKASQGAPWNDDLIDLSALENMNASFKVKTQKIICGDMAIDGLDMLAKIEKGKASLERFQVKQGAGTIDVNGQMNVPASQSASAEIVLDNLPLEKFLSPEQAKNVEAPITGFVKLNFKGRSTREFVSSLNGRIEMKSTDMHLQNFALDKLALSAQSFFGNKKSIVADGTVLKQKNASFLAAFDIEEGVMKTDTFNLKTGEGDVTGEGKVDLVNWKVNYRLVPATKSSIGLSLPILVRGDLSSPSIAPDLTSSQGIGAGIGAAVGGPLGAGVGAAIGNALSKGKSTEKQEAAKKVEEGVNNIINIFNKK